MGELVTTTISPDGIAILTLDMPGQSVNVLSPEVRRAFVEAGDAIIADPAVTGLVVTSGKDSFIAGADLRFLQTLRGAAPETVAEQMALMRDFLRRLELWGKPTVAALTGTALGGGLEIALACGMRVAADNPAAQFGLPEVTLGLLPAAGGTQRLPRLIGIGKALPLMLKGTRLGVGEAKALGLIDRVVSARDLLSAAREMILACEDPARPWDGKNFAAPGMPIDSREAQQFFAVQSAAIHAETRGNFPAPPAILSCVYEGMRLPIDAALKVELGYMIGLVTGDVAQNTIRTFFFSIGDARKAKGRPAAPALELSRLGVLGAGTMGAGIAEVAAGNGLDVVLIDRDKAAAEAGLGQIAASLDKRVGRGLLSREARDATLARIAATGDFADLAGCEAVIEAVFEDRDIKRDVTLKALAATGPDILFGSNTSKIPITDLAKNASRPDRFIGLHFFSPVPRMELLEIIRGAETSDETLAHALDLARILKRVPIVVNDGPGFFTSRCVSTFLNEGMALLRDGVVPAVIENVARAVGMPAGPLMLADGVGLDLMLQIRRQEAADRGAPDEITPEIAVLSRLVDAGRFGRKHGGGFYDYGADGARLWAGLADLWPPASAQPDAAVIGRRLLHIQAIEAVRCFEAGVIDSPVTADIGSVLGWSFARHTGGVCSYIETVGTARFVAECRELAETEGARFAPPRLVEDMARDGRRFY
ncbi:MAG: 3-hydroxyacyl-CoA dehydrogenase NAD-binding domain-containing protein [Pseudochelatococcus sp.]|jgi:3-hydroxyacyl-CoA dehydrogenase/enoyl-CoA hydratase/3-hydroxybutyryl-CoA epimerase|uniref:3-hydroxyacyl-CoA dehydrogenase NAD-binding domain-containing protein n=1 Tax=Pseudochelatococcus sp. TaxID=2020869 RepID=UPI003D9269AE